MRSKSGRFIRETITSTVVRLNDATVSAPEPEIVEPLVSTSTAPAIITIQESREAWLGRALKYCATWMQLNANVVVPEHTRVSCGFPGGGSARKRIGECWPDSASADASTEIFISPVLADAQTVLATLLHEAIHAAVGCVYGHKGPFKRVAVLCGLTGKMTATVASETLKPVLDQWSAELGSYPHAALSLMGRKKQTTRLVKCKCEACGYVVRTTRKWIDDKGSVICPCNNQPMSVEGSEDTDTDAEDAE